MALNLPRSCSSAQGFSLVELMVAMVLGLLLIGGSITIFAGNVRSTRLSQAITALQANARFALDELSADVRAAGYRGCATAADSTLTLSSADAPTDTLRAASIGGASIGAGGTWTPAAPTGYSAPTTTGRPVPGTQVLMVQYGAAPGHVLDSSMSNSFVDLSISGSADDLLAGELALVSNCHSVDVFRIASVSGSGSTRSVQPTTDLSQAYVVDKAFPTSTRVLALVSVIYYIGDTGRSNASGDAVRSLYLQRFPYDAATHPPIELVEGVDQLQISFGMRFADGKTRFLQPGAAALVPADIVLVQVGLLMSSSQRIEESATARAYFLAGRQVNPAGSPGAGSGPVYPADSRIRLPFNTTIKIRNRRETTS